MKRSHEEEAVDITAQSMRGSNKSKVVTSGRLTGGLKGLRSRSRGTPDPGPRPACPEPAYSLYSTSTDPEDQVSSLHTGLDRCAALLTDILQADQAGLPRAVKRATARPTPRSVLGKKHIRNTKSDQRGHQPVQPGPTTQSSIHPPEKQTSFHPPQSSIHPPQSSIHPPEKQTCIHPPEKQTSFHPPQSSIHPPQSSIHPPEKQTCIHPPEKQTSFHPPQSSFHPPQSSFHPPEKQTCIHPPEKQTSFHPPQSSIHPPQSSIHPPEKQTCIHPPEKQTSFHPPQSSIHPPQSSIHPPEKQTCIHPPEKQTSFHPPQSSYHPPQSSIHPPQSSFHPPQTSFHPPQSSIHPPQSSFHPPQTSFHPPQSSIHPPQSSIHPPQSSIQQKQTSFHSPEKQTSIHPPEKQSGAAREELVPVGDMEELSSAVRQTWTCRRSSMHLERGRAEEVPQDSHSSAETDLKVKTVQYLLGELKALIAGQGSVAERLLSHLEQTVSSPLMAASPNIRTEAELLSLHSQNSQLHRPVRIINQQLKQSGRADPHQNLELLHYSQVLSLQEELSAARSRLQEVQEKLTELQKALEDSQSQLTAREAENTLIQAELQAARSRLMDAEREKQELSSLSQHSLEDRGHLSRTLQGHEQHRPDPADRIAQFLMSLAHLDPSRGLQEVRPGDHMVNLDPSRGLQEVRPGDHMAHLDPSRGLQEVPVRVQGSRWDVESVRSASSFDTRDEVWFRDGLAALDASIAGLQRTLHLDRV